MVSLVRAAGSARRLSAGLSALVLLPALVIARPAQAEEKSDEIYVGSSVHGVNTPFTLPTGEEGRDIQAGYRTKPIEGLAAVGSPSAYVHAQVSLDGNTNVVAAGLSWKIGDKVYVRPGIGLAVHDDKIPEGGANGKRVDLGSRILFEPELALGARLSKKMSGEISWVHISNAQLLSSQNPGFDFIGARLVFKLR